MISRRGKLFVPIASICVCWHAAWAIAEPPTAELLQLHRGEATAYRIFRDEARKSALQLRETPVFQWTNVVGEHAQRGHVFLWLHEGRPEAIGTIFSTRASAPGKRMIVHEFHTLSAERLFPETPTTSAYRWSPKRGITLRPCEEVPSVAESASQRLLQMRTIARSFSAESRSREGTTWKLRLLPTPLCQYESPSRQVLQGSLFAMVSSAGTDPELLILVEARRAKEQDKWHWHSAALRFSDKDLTVQQQGKQLWSSLTDEAHRAEIKNDYTLIEQPDKTYACYRARTVDELSAAP